MMYINLCPHDIKDFDSGLELPEAPKPLRVKYKSSKSRLGMLSVQKTDIVGLNYELPEPRPNIVYIVSPQALSVIKGRTDVVAPRKPVRENGVVVGCNGFMNHN